MQETKDDKEDKDDNSFAKNVKEEEKGDTIMKFKVPKNKDKDKDEMLEYNKQDSNNQDSQNNYQDSHLKTDNKIKLNPDILKQSKINTEKHLIEQNKKDNNNDDKIEENDMVFRGFGNNFFSKVNRCFSDKVIMIITFIMLLYSITLLIFNILDFIKIMKYKKSKNYYFMNTLLIFILDIINITSILIYHIMNYLSKPKLEHNIILLLIFIFVIIAIIRSLLFMKKNDKMFAIIINLAQNFFANLINGLTLFFFFIDAKKRKNAMHGIEEIINFTELNANIKSKKEDGLQLDIESSANKEKPTVLVDDDNNNNEGN